MFSGNRTNGRVLVGCLIALWFAGHIPAIGLFAHVPFVSAVVGDEPSPIYGALAILKDRSPLGLRNLPQLYYGPLFAAIAVPVVIFDAGREYAAGHIANAEDYRALITRDMGGMLIASRWLAVLAGLIALYGVYCLFQSKHLNPEGKTWWVWLAVVGIALDPFFFKYSHFFRHWVFIVAVFIWNLVFALRLADKPDDKKAWLGLWFTNVIGFGISFVSLLYQAALLPGLWRWVRAKNFSGLKHFFFYGVSLAAAVVLIVAWDPFPYVRLVGMGTESGSGFELHLGLPSLLTYGSYLFNNHFPIGLLATGLSVLGWVVARERMRRWWWMMILPGLAHITFFAASLNNPPRYLLPIYVLLWLVAVGCAAVLSPWLQARRLAKPSFVIFAIALLLSGANSLRWSWLASQTQPEEKLVETLRETSASSSMLFVGHLLPAWHDPSSYKNFSDHCLDYASDLFPYMATLSPLSGVKPVYIEYWCSDEAIPDDIAGYATDIIKQEGESLESNVLLEANWWRHWDMKKWGLHFRSVKGTLSL